MKLNGEDRLREVLHTLYGSIVEVQMGHFQSFEHDAFGLDCVAVILAGDVASAAVLIKDAVITAAVTVFQLVCKTSLGKGDELVSHADSEDRHLIRSVVAVGDQLFYDEDGFFCGLWVSRPVGQKHAVRL